MLNIPLVCCLWIITILCVFLFRLFVCLNTVLYVILIFNALPFFALMLQKIVWIPLKILSVPGYIYRSFIQCRWAQRAYKHFPFILFAYLSRIFSSSSEHSQLKYTDETLTQTINIGNFRYWMEIFFTLHNNSEYQKRIDERQKCF